MQEDIERRTIAISVTASKLTGKTLAKAFEAALHQIQQSKQNAKTPQGRQSVKKLMNHGVNTSTIPLNGETRLFDRMARKYNVDYAFRKTGSNKYLLFFKAGQADAITACFSEYTKRILHKNRNKSIHRQIQKSADITRKRPRVHERKREPVHSDR